MSATRIRAAGAVLGALVLAALPALLLAPTGPAAGAGVRAGRAVAAAAATDAATTTGATTTGAAAITLAAQSPWVTPGGALDLTVRRHPDLHSAGLGLTITVYDRLHTASAFARALTAPSTDDLLDHTAVVPLPELAVPGQPSLSRITVSVTAGGTSTATATQAALDLECTSDCAGVYPMVVTVAQLSGGRTVGRFTSFLTYEPASPSPSPLRVGLVLPISVPASFSGTPGPAGSTTALSEGAVDAACSTVNVLAHARVPVTVQAVPQTVQAMQQRCRTGAAPSTGPSNASSRSHSAPTATLSGPRAVGDLALMSTDQDTFNLPAQTYVPTDPSMLTSAGLDSELTAQLARGQEVLTADHIAAPRGTWVLTQAPGGDLRSGLAAVGANRLVVPEGDLSSLPDTTLTQPFHLDLGHGARALAAGSSAQAAALTTAHPHDPVLAATQLLADLALVQSELPDATDPRGVVVVPPASWQPDPAFVAALLQGLAKNPVLNPVTLSQYFATVPVGGNGQDDSRGISGTGPTLSARTAGAISNGRSRLSSFASAATRATTVLTILGDDLLSTEGAALSASERSAGLAAFTSALGAQVSNIQFSSENTITLTSRVASLPVTIFSSAPYAVVAHLTLSSDKLQFPSGASRTVTINRTTNQIRIPVRARTSGDLPMEVTLSAPAGGLVIARGRITVRSTATSVVGVVLTVVALVVLLGWWARTWWRGRRMRTEATK